MKNSYQDSNEEKEGPWTWVQGVKDSDLETAVM